MITGEDTVFIANRDPAAPVEGFLGALAERWPNLMVCSEEGDNDGFLPWVAKPSVVPRGTGSILIARDERMVVEWDERGYDLDPFNEGPIYIAYRPTLWVNLQVQVLENPLGDKGFSFYPYEVTLTGQGYHVLTAVTPPLESDFTQEILKKIKYFLSS